MKGYWLTLVVATATMACGGAMRGSSAPSPTPLAAEDAVEVFDFAWTRVHETYYDTTFGGLDWRKRGWRRW